MMAMAMVLAGVLLTLQPCAFALNPSLDISQYAHTAWKVREGFAKGEIISIAQTPDGYIWLGTAFGLLRFDGVKNVSWQPPTGQHLPSDVIMSLLAARDGTLWIGTLNGLASWKDGKLTEYQEFAGRQVFALLEDHEGTVWVTGNAVTTGKLCAIRNGNIECQGEGSLGRGAFNLYEDSKGSLWAGVVDGLWKWKPGPPKFYRLADEPNAVQALGEDMDGTLLVGWKGEIHRFIDGKFEAYALPSTMPRTNPRRILRDRDGGLWIGTLGQGIVHVHQGRTDIFAQPDGLSSGNVQSLFEDREGNIWVTTVNGLDRFRDFAVATLTGDQGLSGTLVEAVLADRDGSVWISTNGGLNRWKNGEIAIPDTNSVQRDGKLNGLIPNSLFQDDRGKIWISTQRQFGYLENGRFNPVKNIPSGAVLSIAQDRAKNLWLANEPLGLFRLSPTNEVQQIPWASLGHKDHASVLAADPLHGGLWIGFFLGGIAYFADGQIRASYTAADGLGEGRVGGFQFDHDGTLWAATAGGLSRLKNGRVTTLTNRNGLPCNKVNWVMEDDARSVWLYMACGLVRISRAELDAWSAAADEKRDAKRAIQATVFDTFDGVRSLPDSGHFGPQVAKSQDGKIWFLPLDGVSVVDPRRLAFNQVPPPVHIEQVTVDRRTYQATSKLRLPPLLRDLEIDYTALSLGTPEKVRFRYKLENWDRDWQDAKNRRQAFYGNLPPGNYHFRVMACNNSGVWNEASGSLDFFVAPAYYQTFWFRFLCGAALLAVLFALYRMRVQQLGRQFNVRLDERVRERTRIARDLHDTLLQSFQGVLLKFHAVTYLMTERPAEARKTLQNVIEQATQAINEGRDAVQGLRSSTAVANDLPAAISLLGDELAATLAGQYPPDFIVNVEGAPRDLSPLVAEDVYRIAAEALRNAFRHSHARKIEVELRYDQRQLRLRVRDNGEGIDPRVLAGGHPGHYGLAGMHERAKLIGGKLAVWSESDSGAEAELTIPAAIAYARVQSSRRSILWRRGA